MLAHAKFEWRFINVNFRRVLIIDDCGISVGNYPQVAITWPNCWKVDIGTGNGLVPSGNGSLAEPMLTQLYGEFSNCAFSLLDSQGLRKININQTNSFYEIKTNIVLLITDCTCPWLRTIRSLMTLIARFMGPTWDPSGADRNQVGPMLAPWTMLSGCAGHVRDNCSHVFFPLLATELICIEIWQGWQIWFR